MSWSGFRIAACISGISGMVILLAALATSSWMKGCQSTDKLNSATTSLLEKQGKAIPWNMQKSIDATSGMQLCWDIGLFRVSLKCGDVYEVGFAAEASSMPTFSFIVIAGFLIATAIGISGLFVLIRSPGGNSYEEKSKNSSNTRKAIILFTVTGLIALGAMICYTANTSQAVHDPIMFLAYFGKESISALDQFDKMSGLDLLSQTNRRKRAVDLESLDLNDNMKEFLRTAVDGVDPAYSYSYALGWIAILLIFLTAILNICGLLQSQHSPYTSSPQDIKI